MESLLKNALPYLRKCEKQQLLNTSNSAQKGYVHSQLILQNEELENLNKELRIKVIDAKALINLENNDKVDFMDEPEGNPVLIP